MKPAVLIAASVIIAGVIVGVSLDKVSQSMLRLNNTVLMRGSPSHHVTVSPANGTFRVSGDGSAHPPAAPDRGPQVSDREGYSKVTNVIVVSQNVTPGQLAEAPKTLIGRWRDENSYADYRADGTCTWTLDSGEVNHRQWKIEGDTIVESGNGKVASRRRLLELSATHFTYQQFPTGSLWRAWRVDEKPTPVPAPQAEKEPR